MYQLTTLHPLAAQFPSVLLLITPVGLLIWSQLQNKSWFFAGLLNATAGALGITAAWVTGESARSHVHDPILVDAFLNAHILYGVIAIPLAWLVVLLLVLSYMRSNYEERSSTKVRVPHWIRITIITVSIIAGIATALSVRLGFLMSWGTY